MSSDGAFRAAVLGVATVTSLTLGLTLSKQGGKKKAKPAENGAKPIEQQASALAQQEAAKLLASDVGNDGDASAMSAAVPGSSPRPRTNSSSSRASSVDGDAADDESRSIWTVEKIALVLTQRPDEHAKKWAARHGKAAAAMASPRSAGGS